MSINHPSSLNKDLHCSRGNEFGYAEHETNLLDFGTLAGGVLRVGRCPARGRWPASLKTIVFGHFSPHEYGGEYIVTGRNDFSCALSIYPYMSMTVDPQGWTELLWISHFITVCVSLSNSYGCKIKHDLIRTRNFSKFTMTQICQNKTSIFARDFRKKPLTFYRKTRARGSTSTIHQTVIPDG